MSLDLKSLKYFVAVAEELHFARAAARLAMTQPPLSQAILALEQDLGQALFIRNKRQVRLSAAGAALLPHARELLAQAAQLPQIAARAAAGNLGRLRLSFVSIADYSLLPPLLARLHQSCGEVEVSLREATTDLQLEALLRQETDAALLLGPLPPAAAAVLHYRPLLRENLLLAYPAALAGQLPQGDAQAILQAAAQTLPLIIFPRQVAPLLHDLILSCFAQARATPVSGQQAIQMQTIVSLVSAGLGMALAPASLAQLQRTGVAYLPLPGLAAQVESGLAWRQDQQNPLLARLARIATESAIDVARQFAATITAVTD
ncbi:LysR family transcriptional regulator [Massilia sp. W12]|uniref:LysR family transcriptional regulator n=1 Tax=Massilia sp. W12 TaxID=3126507 RepID=UPI0030D280C0